MEVKKTKKIAVYWFQNRILAWYVRNGRHFPWRNKSASKYQVIIAEILLQRTRAETVASFYKSFIKEFPSWSNLDKSSESNLREFLKPIGLWRQKAVSIKQLANEMARRKSRFPKKREDVENLSGVGQYIANAIELFCNNKPKPLLDVNMARVLERFFGARKLADIRYDPYLQDLALKVVPKEKAKEFNWAILDFAALICKVKNPLCNNCPLSERCNFNKKDKLI